MNAFHALFDSRIIYITGQINAEMSSSVISQLLLLESEDAEQDITLCISSEGGSVVDGLAIIDVMNHVSCDVCTVGIGMVCSMAAAIFSSGAKGKRYSLPHTEFLLHQLMSGIPQMTQAEDMRIAMNHVMTTKQSLNRLLSENTGKTIRQIEKDTDRDYWMNAEEAVHYGLADSVLCKGRKKNQECAPHGS